MLWLPWTCLPYCYSGRPSKARTVCFIIFTETSHSSVLDSYESRDITHSLYIVSLVIEWYCSPQWLKKIDVFLTDLAAGKFRCRGCMWWQPCCIESQWMASQDERRLPGMRREGPDDVSSGGRGGREREGRGWMRMNMRLSLTMFIWEGKAIYSKAILLMMNMPAAGHWPIQKSGTLLNYSVLEGSTSYNVALAGFSMNFWWPFRP